MRLVLLLAFMPQSEDGVEGKLAQVAQLSLQWGLSEAVTPLARRLVLGAQARLGLIPHSHARQAGAIRLRPVLFACTAAAASLGLLLRAGHSQMPLFIVFSSFLLPLWQAVLFPRLWVSVPLLVAVLSGTWAWEGVRPLFVGLALFQLLPISTEMWNRWATQRSSPRLRALGSRAFWWAALCLVAPLVAVALTAMFAPAHLYALTTAVTGERSPVEAPVFEAESALVRCWQLLQRALGVGRGPEDPWRVLKLSRGATAAQIRKRSRELSLQYHPDKVGNNPISLARFLQIQAAVEALTARGAREAAEAAITRATHEAAHEAVTRCVESLGVVGIWIGMSLLGWLGALLGFGQQQAAAAAAADAAAVQAAQTQAAGLFGFVAPPVAAFAAPAFAQPATPVLPRIPAAAPSPASQPPTPVAAKKEKATAPSISPVAPPAVGLEGMIARIGAPPKTEPAARLTGAQRRAARRGATATSGTA